MSTIERLSIQGIRSFGTEAQDKQTITFSSPLNLIIGDNGCGKTTIIECLKYAITGEFPSGTNRGKSFVHDPRITRCVECMGQVKLRVRTIKGIQITATRSIKSTLVKNQLKFGTVDSSVSYEGDGQRGTIGRRCIDINVEMCEAMGVSKAIVNNVIFCHQEDAEWPMQESQKLKEKFDAIFGTTQYNKVIDKIIKMRKMYMDQQKQKNGDLKLLEHLKTVTENKNLELEQAKNKMNQFKAKVDQCNADLKPIRSRLIEIHEVELNLSKLYAQKVEFKTKLDNFKKHQSTLKSKIKKIYAGSITSLNQKVSDFQGAIGVKHCDLIEMRTELDALKQSEKKLQDTLNEYEKKRVTLLMERQQEQEANSARANNVKDLADRLSVSVPNDIENSNEVFASVFKEVRSSFKCENEKIATMSRDFDQQDAKAQTDIDKLREKKASLEGDIAAKRNQVQQLNSEQRKNDAEIENIERSAHLLKQLVVDIEKVTREYDDLSTQVDLNAIDECISSARKKQTTLQNSLDKVDGELRILGSVSQLSAQLKMREEQFGNRSVDKQRLENKHRDDFRKLFGDNKPTQNFKRSLQTMYDRLDAKIKEIGRSAVVHQRKMIELETKRKAQRDELVRNEAQLAEGEEKVFQACFSTKYTDAVEAQRIVVDELRSSHGTYHASELMFKRFVRKIDEVSSCPLCHKNMSGREMHDIKSELTEQVAELPTKLASVEESIKENQIKYDMLLSLAPLVEKIEELKINIPKRKQVLHETELQLVSERKAGEAAEAPLADLNSQMKLANSMLGDMSLLDEVVKDIAMLEKEIAAAKERFPKNCPKGCLEDVQIERSTVAGELKSARNELDDLQSKRHTSSVKLATLREQKNGMKDKQIKLQQGVQALSQLKLRKEEIGAQIAVIGIELDELDVALGPLKQDLNQAVDQKQKQREVNRKRLASEQRRIDELKQGIAEIVRITERIDQLTRRNLGDAIERLKNLLTTVMGDQKRQAAKHVDLDERITRITTEIASCAVDERDLLDNLELKQSEADEAELQVELNDLKAKIGDTDGGNIIAEKQKLNDIERKTNGQLSKLQGQMNEVEEQIVVAKAQLAEPKYKESIVNYRRMYYEIYVIQKIVDDLARYNRALEAALLKFHAEKMETINRLIRILWRSIYRGNDIDYIQIKTDEIEQGGASVKSDKRRSYSYRVVQSKQDTELDMQGRCSAGQKVLASIIIRIALAETFSANCGVLALDEPTTNLDRTNIQSLCESLNQFIVDRQSQSNFMLIVITHDEDFITALGKIESYYRISRNEHGMSVIDRIRAN